MGRLVGPATGSLVYGAFGYEVTMFFYAFFALVCLFMNARVLPDSLDKNESDDDDLLSNRRSPEELKLLKGYNKITFEEIGIMTVTCDRICFLAYLESFMAMFAFEQFVGYLSIYLNE